MSNKLKSGLVPKLRFPEFQQAGVWASEPLKPYLEDCSGRVPSGTDLPIYSSTREGLKRQDAYFDGQVLQNKNEYGVVPPGCFVYRHMSDDGQFKFNINQTGGDIAVSKEYPVFRTKGLNPIFLLAKLNEGVEFKEFAFSQKAGGTRTRLYFSRLCEWETPLPSPSEQQKIALCLSSLDELIAAQARKVDALKTHKKGLMQQLFPREGETQPRMRFPEFQAASAWEETFIGALGRFYYGKSAPKWSLDDDAPTKCVRYGELYTKFGPTITETISRTNIEPKNLRFSKGGEILVPRVGEKPEDFGTCCSYLPLKNIAIGEMISVFETKEHPLFYTYYFRNLYKEFARVVEGQNVKNLYFVNLEPIPISRPPIAEQELLADFFASLDNCITAATKELVTLKTHKKGLLQRLFPSAEVV